MLPVFGQLRSVFFNCPKIGKTGNISQIQVPKLVFSLFGTFSFPSKSTLSPKKHSLEFRDFLTVSRRDAVPYLFDKTEKATIQ